MIRDMCVEAEAKRNEYVPVPHRRGVGSGDDARSCSYHRRVARGRGQLLCRGGRAGGVQPDLIKSIRLGEIRCRSRCVRAESGGNAEQGREIPLRGAVYYGCDVVT